MGRVGALPPSGGSAILPPDTAPGADPTDAVRHCLRPDVSETRRGRYGQTQDRSTPGRGRISKPVDRARPRQPGDPSSVPYIGTPSPAPGATGLKRVDHG